MICRPRPANNVRASPKRAAIQPAVRLVTDARHLIQSEQVVRLYQLEAKPVELQQHQYPQGTIRQLERPIGRRHRRMGVQGIGRGIVHVAMLAATIRTMSAKRQE